MLREADKLRFISQFSGSPVKKQRSNDWQLVGIAENEWRKEGIAWNCFALSELFTLGKTEVA